LYGKTLGDLVRRKAGVRLWCQACSVQAFVETARCGTCGGAEAQGAGWSPEPRDANTCILLVREHARGPTVNRPLGNTL
jgi:hypothetical protein